MTNERREKSGEARASKHFCNIGILNKANYLRHTQAEPQLPAVQCTGPRGIVHIFFQKIVKIYNHPTFFKYFYIPLFFAWLGTSDLSALFN